jgi:adenylate cyclase
MSQAYAIMVAIDERTHLERRLRHAGLTEAEIRDAAQEGRLPTLAVELALGEPPRHSLTHVARESHLSPAFVRSLMQAAGRPIPAPRERVYSDEDVRFARTVGRFVEAGLPAEGLLEVARVTSLGMANVAGAVRRLAGDALLEPGDSEHAVGLRYATAADELVPLMARQLDYHFRMHLRDGIRRQLVTEAELQAGRLADTREIAVAFADLVDYTKLGERLAPEDVGRIAGRLAQLSAQSVRRPCELIKTIGDAAMLVSPEPDALVESCDRLMRAVAAEGEEFPELRIGMTIGPATTRGGDWFGASVNVASRITGVAKPGRVFASEAMRDRTPERPWKRKRKRSLRGVEGRVRLYALGDDEAADLAS